MLRKTVWLAVVALALPMAALANSIDVSNAGGVVSGGAGGLNLTGSTMFKFGSIVGTNLGSVGFATGAFTSGNAQMGGNLAAGGTFTITGNGSNGVPNGVIFSGTFSSATWELITAENGTHTYNLVGALLSANGETGATVQLTVNTGTAFFSGSANLSSGDTSLNIVVPEPSTLSLFGTGLLGLAGVIRRRRALNS